ncbi:MAG: hypothetical protein VYD32_03085, partial [Pseudomonadota bacterium]|nr:hypothetical protein [Pseudomonadota bacterium]
FNVGLFEVSDTNELNPALPSRASFKTISHQLRAKNAPNRTVSVQKQHRIKDICQIHCKSPPE